MKLLMGDPGVRATYGEGRDSDEYVGGWIDHDVALRARGIPGMHALTLTAKDGFLGVCGLLEQTVEGVTEMEIAYLLRDHARGNGYATEAARFWRDRAFATLGLTRVVSIILKQNLPSIAVAERNGMRRERQATFRGSPIYVYAIERPEWEAANLHKP